MLVVDGKPMRQFYTSIFLQRLKYHVIMAKTAADGLVFMDLTVPLVVIVNIDLPDMSGLDILKRVKQNPKMRNVPVVVCTSNKDPRIQAECEQAGCAGYLRHPATLEELYVAIQKATKKPRRFVRLDTFLEVTVGEGSAGASKGKDYVAAISELGMFVSGNTRFTYESVHSFTFFLPNAPGWIIRVEGEIVYNYISRDPNKLPGAGVKFVKIGQQEREFIKDFIRGKLTEGIAGR